MDWEGDHKHGTCCCVMRMKNAARGRGRGGWAHVWVGEVGEGELARSLVLRHDTHTWCPPGLPVGAPGLVVVELLLGQGEVLPPQVQGEDGREAALVAVDLHNAVLLCSGERGWTGRAWHEEW